jgi:hypothetical protein
MPVLVRTFVAAPLLAAWVTPGLAAKRRAAAHLSLDSVNGARLERSARTPSQALDVAAFRELEQLPGERIDAELLGLLLGRDSKAALRTYHISRVTITGRERVGNR